MGTGVAENYWGNYVTNTYTVACFYLNKWVSITFGKIKCGINNCFNIFFIYFNKFVESCF